MKRDKQATEVKHFIDPKSYVLKDGREVLAGLDWKQRVGELRERSGGRCEKLVSSADPMTHAGGQSVERCRSEAQDPDHIIKRSKGRDDRLTNLEALCRLHHELKHPEKRTRWGEKGSKA